MQPSRSRLSGGDVPGWAQTWPAAGSSPAASLTTWRTRSSGSQRCGTQNRPCWRGVRWTQSTALSGSHRRSTSSTPTYRFEIKTDGARSSVTAFPGYKGAERDCPIIGRFEFRFPDDEEGRAARDAFERALDFGTGATITGQYLERLGLDLPAKLGDAIDHVTTLEIGATAPRLDSRTFLLASVGPSGSTLAEVPVDLGVTNRSRRGAIMGWALLGRTRPSFRRLRARLRSSRTPGSLR